MHAIGDTWEPRFCIRLPVEDHRLRVCGNEDAAIREVDKVREVVAVDRVVQELAVDLETVMAWKSEMNC